MTPKRNQNVDNIKLCELVKAAPCLYNSDHPDYNNKKAQDVAWKLIAEQLGQTESICETQFRYLSCQYAKSIGVYKPVRPYYLRNELEFLKPFLIQDFLSKQLNDSARSALEEDLQLAEHSEVGTSKDALEIEQSNDAKLDIILLEDKPFLERILYEMQNMNESQKDIFKEKMWGSVRTVRNPVRNNSTSFETDMQSITHGVARLNENIDNDNNRGNNAIDESDQPSTGPVNKKQEPTSTVKVRGIKERQRLSEDIA